LFTWGTTLDERPPGQHQARTDDDVPVRKAANKYTNVYTILTNVLVMRIFDIIIGMYSNSFDLSLSLSRLTSAVFK
jgi:hypothetical protein